MELERDMSGLGVDLVATIPASPKQDVHDTEVNAGLITPHSEATDAVDNVDTVEIVDLTGSPDEYDVINLSQEAEEGGSTSEEPIITRTSVSDTQVKTETQSDGTSEVSGSIYNNGGHRRSSLIAKQYIDGHIHL